LRKTENEPPFFIAAALQLDAMQIAQIVFLSRERVLAAQYEFIADGITRTPPHVA
jgi:hypothetical protein